MFLNTRSFDTLICTSVFCLRCLFSCHPKQVTRLFCPSLLGKQKLPEDKSLSFCFWLKYLLTGGPKGWRDKHAAPTQHLEGAAGLQKGVWVLHPRALDIGQGSATRARTQCSSSHGGGGPRFQVDNEHLWPFCLPDTTQHSLRLSGPRVRGGKLPIL